MCSEADKLCAMDIIATKQHDFLLFQQLYNVAHDIRMALLVTRSDLIADRRVDNALDSLKNITDDMGLLEGTLLDRINAPGEKQKR